MVLVEILLDFLKKKIGNNNIKRENARKYS